jgi:hypothetical protein
MGRRRLTPRWWSSTPAQVSYIPVALLRVGLTIIPLDSPSTTMPSSSSGDPDDHRSAEVARSGAWDHSGAALQPTDGRSVRPLDPPFHSVPWKAASPGNGRAAVTAFVTMLAAKEQVSASTQTQALSAVVFLYRAVLRKDIGELAGIPRARASTHVPVVLGAQDIRRILDALDGVPRLAAMLLYGAGLRLQECLELRGIARKGPRSGLWAGGVAGSACAEVSRGAGGMAVAVRFSGGEDLSEPAVWASVAFSSARIGDSASGDRRSAASWRYGAGDVSHVSTLVCDAPAGVGQ